MADLELWLDAGESGVRLALPSCHAPFLVDGGRTGGLRLRIRDGPLHRREGWRSLFYDAENWQLWRDGEGRFVFVASRHSPPPRQIAVDADFRSGEVVGEFGASQAAERAVYPLRDIDMVLYANWLAKTGDLILHAAGIDEEGTGYAFAGPPGAGKSTLVGELAEAAKAATTKNGTTAKAATTNEKRGAVVVLGEDQVILRYQEGQFVVYGTPWHTDPARCSPGGVPLRKLFFLDRATGHGVEPCGTRAGIERLLQNAFIPYYNHAGVERILDGLSRLAEQVSFYTLGFQIGADIIGLVRDA